MRLPATFPHSRHEQYVVVLPDGLLSRAEMLEAIAVLDRARLFYAAVRHIAVAELVRRGWSYEEIERGVLSRLPSQGE